MSGLDHISVTLEAGGSCPGKTRDVSIVLPILHEIRHALDRLIETGDETRIDLNAMPLGPGDLERLTALLGTGEVRATVEAFGPTLVQETAIPGVWLVDYQNSETKRLTLQIEIAPVPEILRPQPLDLAESIATLDTRLDQLQGQSDPPLSF
jgi:hydrogenase-1 operon protein HyaF